MTAIAPAGPTDADAIWPLVRELHRHEGLPEPGPAVRSALDRLLATPALGRVLLAREEGGIAGYCVLGFGYSLEFHGRDAFVDELLVREDRRGQGLSGRLLDAAEALCRAEGVRALHLESGHANPRATALYARRGFTAHERHLMTKWLA